MGRLTSCINRAEIDWIVQNLFVGNQSHRRRGAQRGRQRRGGPAQCALAHRGLCLLGRQHHAAAAGAELDSRSLRQASTRSSPTSSQVIVYCLHEKVGHLGIFVLGRRGQPLEHTELFSALDLIDVLPPGLVRSAHRGHRARHLAPGSDRRALPDALRAPLTTIDDILALDDGRDDERPFEVVRRVAEISQRLYDTFASPAVQAMSNELGAYTMRQMHPGPSRALAGVGRESVDGVARRLRPGGPARGSAAGGAGQSLRHAGACGLRHHPMRTLDAWRDQRDALYEQTFEAPLQSPWLSALVGFLAGRRKARPAAAERGAAAGTGRRGTSMRRKPGLSGALRWTPSCASWPTWRTKTPVSRSVRSTSCGRWRASTCSSNRTLPQSRPRSGGRALSSASMPARVAALPLLVPDSTQRHRSDHDGDPPHPYRSRTARWRAPGDAIARWRA
ncbi:DUF3141 domain-containing protein [Cupriavidus basilensis]